VPAVEKQLVKCDEFLREVKERLLLAQDLMKNTYNKHHDELTLLAGNWLWLRLHHRIAAN
jgi:hypothetical protein